MTLGYAPQQQRYVGIWIGSMMTHLWQDDGELDAGKTVLTLNSAGPVMTGEEKQPQLWFKFNRSIGSNLYYL